MFFVSFTGYGVLRGPIRDTDCGLWPILHSFDHPGCGVCCIMEVNFVSMLCLNVKMQRFVTYNCHCSFEKYKLITYFYIRYIRSERSIILINFCLSIICSNILILVGQTQTHNAVKSILYFQHFVLYCLALFHKLDELYFSDFIHSG